MNKMISKAGSAIVTVTVFLFAIFLLINFSMGGYFVCLILPIGFIMMTAGLNNECEGDRKVAANIGLILAAVYGTFMPSTGMFVKMSSGGNGFGGRLALVVWCVYFLPIGILSLLHFRSE